MKKKVKVIKKIEFLNMGCYPGTVLFSVGFSYKELKNTIDKQYKIGRWKDEDRLWLRGIENEDKLLNSGTYFALKRELINEKIGLEKTLYYIIITEQFKFTDYEMCKLAHEIIHICQFFLPDILDRNKEIEAEAYLHTHLMQQSLKILRK